MTQREDQRYLTRQKLLVAAAALFEANGFADTTTMDIARLAGVSHGSFFVHFPRREDLIEAVVEQFGTKLVLRTHELAEQGTSVREVLQAHLHGLAEEEPFYTRLIEEASSLPPEARAILVGIQSAISHTINAAAKREAETGRVRVMSPHLLFNTWMGLVHYYLTNRDLFAPGESVIARHGNDLINHFVSLISTAEGGSQ